VEATLLVELLTEELPPKSLIQLGQAFADGVCNGLVGHQLKLRDFTGRRVFATPRRLAVLVPEVLGTAPDRFSEVTGPSVKASPEAVAGFAKKHGVEVSALEQRDTPKGAVCVARITVKGVSLHAVLSNVVQDAVRKLPVPKVMRWSNGDAQFVRPVHGLVMLHGTRQIPGTALGVAAGSTTRGHRFMGARSIALKSADEYESRLADDGWVIADFAGRRGQIETQLLAEAKRHRAALGDYENLLDEVTALVEHPTVYAAAFDPVFLQMPQECLILTMRQNQKYFPLFDAAGKLLPNFLIVSNMKVADPRQIIGGNERVVRPRLQDARFFYDQDRKTRLEERVPQLRKVVYHNKLGSQLERVERIQLLAGRIARELGANAALAERAAWLAKADLVTGMVGEFPELQGTMGRYYALHDGEPREVADAIEAHYRPRYSGDRLPDGAVACAVALADKLDTLVGMFSIGGAPTGDRDPFALRRAALGVLRILIEVKMPLDLPAYTGPEVYAFMMERLRHLLREQGYAADEVESVVSQSPARIDLVPARLEAVKSFRHLPEAENLAAANKRIRNILRKSDATEGKFDETLLREPAERAVLDAMRKIKPEVAALIRRGEYRESLGAVARLQVPVDAFFDKVLVNAEDPRLRANRHSLLKELDVLMNQVADLSKLAR